ncbi:MAG: bacillithiol biosynthesis deacetylase BshB1 [Bacteroidetes bacterium]|nr:bacillithiol biosynthesis deacetylase BshB1 [Bacteroidota bacterium]HET6245037.1 bacillithiol biosynthesis deacetylase BshB1 [Bacteroidia bacterium]
MKLDILAFGAHPDDVELGCSGTILHHNSLGLQTGIIDLTRGELGTRGNADLRVKEAQKAAEILEVKVRENLLFADGFFNTDQYHLLQVIKKLRHYKPKVVLCNAMSDRHPDHGRAGKLISDACFYSGLIKIETNMNGFPQEAWRPDSVYHYVQDRYIKPDIAIDITAFMEQKTTAILAFSSQFFNPDSIEPQTPISGEDFLEVVKSRAADFGRQIGVRYAEGYTVERLIGVNSFFDLK